MYFGKLDGRIDTDFFDRKVGALFRRRCRAEKRWHRMYRPKISSSWKRKSRLRALKPAFLIIGSACWARTSDPLINSQLLYQLS